MFDYNRNIDIKFDYKSFTKEQKEIIKYLISSYPLWRFSPYYKNIYFYALTCFLENTEYLPFTNARLKKNKWYIKQYKLYAQNVEGISMSAWIFINRKVHEYNEYKNK